MFIGFLSYTNEAVIGEMRDADLSVLEESVLEDLDLKHMDASELTRTTERLDLPRKDGRGTKTETPVLEQGPHQASVGEHQADGGWGRAGRRPERQLPRSLRNDEGRGQHQRKAADLTELNKAIFEQLRLVLGSWERSGRT